jgi:putative ABC transport system permease protein
MILLQLRIIFRNFKNTKLYSAITILGLTVGMTATILLFTYVQHELSFDHFNEKSDRIYRLNSILTRETEEILTITLGLKDSILQKQVPEIEELLQIKESNSFNKTEFTHNNIKFKNISLIYSDPNFHKVFTIKYLRGNVDLALINPNSVILTRSLAQRMFGSIDIIGNIILEQYSKNPITITGVIEDYPSASHLKIDAIIPLNHIAYIYKEQFELNTYILFHNNINLKKGIDKTTGSYNTLLSQRIKDLSYKKTGCFLQKLTDIHLKSGFQSKGGVDSEYKKLFIYLSLALIVLFIAIINFINLLTAQYESKLRNIGIQKAIGGSRLQIIISFLAKSFIFSFISLIFAAFLVAILIPKLGLILNRDLISTYKNIFTLFVWLPLLAVVVGLISGIYPALFISGFSPDNLIKRNLSVTRSSMFTRVLVVIQFSIMIFLIVSLIVMKKQILFMKNANLGIDPEGVISISIDDLKYDREKFYTAIKNELKSIPEIKSFGASHHLFGGRPSTQRIEVIGNGPKKEYPINEYRVMPGFFESLGFRFAAGRAFDENIKTDETAVVLNETAVRLFGLTDPLNSRILKADTMRVIGVVKDFHFSSFEESIEPIMFRYDNNIMNVVLKISGNDIHNVLLKVEELIKVFDPDYVMDYVMLEDFCRNRYASYEQMETLSTYAAIFSLLLAMLGLYALTAIMVQKRDKEIALRKINGATRIQVVILLISSYILQVIVAFIIAAPVGWYVMHGWLKNFAYKTGISWWIFLLTGLIAGVIAVLTVSWQSWKAATINPVESLRVE